MNGRTSEPVHGYYFAQFLEFGIAGENGGVVDQCGRGCKAVSVRDRVLCFQLRCLPDECIVGEDDSDGQTKEILHEILRTL